MKRRIHFHLLLTLTPSVAAKYKYVSQEENLRNVRRRGSEWIDIDNRAKRDIQYTTVIFGHGLMHSHGISTPTFNNGEKGIRPSALNE